MARRRKPSAGSIYRNTYRDRQGKKRASAFWWIKYHGIRESTQTPDYDEAVEILKRRMAEHAGGRVTEKSSRITVGHLLDLLLADYKANNRKSLYTVSGRVAKHLREPFGEIPVRQLRSSDVRRFIRDRQRENAANATINRELAALRTALKIGKHSEPPIISLVRVPMLAEDNVREGFLEYENYARLRDVLAPHLQAVFVVGYHLGVRKSELLSFGWHQVNLKTGIILVPQRSTKNREPHAVPIFGEMRAWVELAKAERDSRYPNCPWVFHYRGEQIRDFREGWKAACKRAKLAGLTFHDLRRSAAVNMDRAGVPRRVIMEITGHKTESMFLRYRIVSERDFREAGRRMEAYFQAGINTQKSGLQGIDAGIVEGKTKSDDTAQVI